MPNPYAPPPINAAEDRKFRLRESFQTAQETMKVGLLCGIVGGVIMEYAVRKFPYIGTMSHMAGPGLVFGIGVLYAAWRALPDARKSMLLSFPFFALASFVVIGMMWELARPYVTGGSYLGAWMILSIFSVPGVLILALGCLLVARPRSYLRFILFVIVTALLAGGGPILTALVENVQGFLPMRFVAMFISQSLMFGMLGWIFGDALTSERVGSEDRE